MTDTTWHVAVRLVEDETTTRADAILELSDQRELLEAPLYIGDDNSPETRLLPARKRGRLTRLICSSPAGHHRSEPAGPLCVRAGILV